MGAKKIYREIAGQAFWEELTDDSEFYIKLIMLMGDIPRKHIEKYKPQLDAALNRFTLEFTKDFCTKGGQIDWEKLVKFVSEKPTAKITKFKKNQKINL